MHICGLVLRKRKAIPAQIKQEQLVPQAALAILLHKNQNTKPPPPLPALKKKTTLKKTFTKPHNADRKKPEAESNTSSLHASVWSGTSSVPSITPVHKEVTAWQVLLRIKTNQRHPERAERGDRYSQPGGDRQQLQKAASTMGTSASIHMGCSLPHGMLLLQMASRYQGLRSFFLESL